MNELAYRLVQDRHKKPLVTIETGLGNGQELYPDALRRLAATLLQIADEAETRDMGKHYCPAQKTMQF